MRFFLGIDHPSWIAELGVPCFVSRTTLEHRRSFPVPAAPWVLDSGAFSELSRHGIWTVSARRYAAFAVRVRNAMPGLEWAAQQDWMCEPWMLEKTGLTIAEHQQRTVRNFLELRELEPSIPWAPVLQGWKLDDYLRAVDLFEQHGVALEGEPVVGVGSVCRRQKTREAILIFRRLAKLGLHLHAFGLKMLGLRHTADCLVSADSMAWSWNGRHNKKRCPDGKRNCAHCRHYALEWRERMLQEIEKGLDPMTASKWIQQELFV